MFAVAYIQTLAVRFSSSKVTNFPLFDDIQTFTYAEHHFRNTFRICKCTIYFFYLFNVEISDLLRIFILLSLRLNTTQLYFSLMAI